MPRWLFWVMAVLLLVPAALFAIKNSGLVPIDLWPFLSPFSLPLSGVIYIALVLGFIVGVFVHWVHDRHRRQRTRDLQDHADVLTRQIGELRRDQAAAQARIMQSASATDLTTLTGT
jgi:uncharacterized integral membrane protein